MSHKLMTIALFGVVAALIFTGAPLSAAAHAEANFKTEALARVDQLQERLVALAEAVPADKYSYKPMEGTRSIGDEFMHVAGANYGTGRMIGTPPPEGFDFRAFGSSATEKGDIVMKLKESFKHFRGAVAAMDAGMPNKPTKIFGGQETTYRGATWALLSHLAEHFGKLISNTRAVGVVPPWSE